jgi:hypothetical protein
MVVICGVDIMKYACWLSMVPAVLFSLPSQAEEGAKPAALSPQEVSEGWISLFDGETLFGWKQVGEGNWTIVEGMLAPQKGNKSTLVTTTAFSDYELQLDYRLRNESLASLRIGCDGEGKLPRDQDEFALKQRFGNDWITQSVTVKGGRVVGESFRTGRFSEGSGVRSSSTGQDPPPHSGYLGITGQHFVIRNIKLRPGGARPIFNGKDLTGWKEVAGKKTKFSVTKEGLLEAKDGPGDLQTEDQWADFVLQIECLCNGDRLNSGVFFRCRPGEFWQGYESQVHSGFDEQKPKEYTLEDYDPKTNELTGKRKEKYAAMDYGTGGIYNRQPARMQACKDREWFTMTVIAQGRHMGVWVNGIMVTDWTDNRPLADNARKGCRLEKGTIGLQGHDPTTDLNFRNIRIAELPALAEIGSKPR